jgi:hypothetical protein
LYNYISSSYLLCQNNHEPNQKTRLVYWSQPQRSIAKTVGELSKSPIKI